MTTELLSRKKKVDDGVIRVVLLAKRKRLLNAEALRPAPFGDFTVQL